MRTYFIAIFLPLLSFASDAEQVFTAIYEQGAWGFNEEGIGCSGVGSSLEQSATYIKFLEDFMKANQIRSVVDVGCGDWAVSQKICWEGIDYTGFDVVKSVINRNQAKFGRDKVKFVHADATGVDLPSADLLVCKDVLQHLSNEDILKFLEQVKKFKHCLITNDVEVATLSSSYNNFLIMRGGYRPLDLTKEPFSLKGVKIFNYPSGYETKQILYIGNYHED